MDAGWGRVKEGRDEKNIKLNKVAAPGVAVDTDLTLITPIQHAHTQVRTRPHLWHTSAWGGLSVEACQRRPVRGGVVYPWWIYEIWSTAVSLSPGNTACICGMNKRLVPKRVQVCFQRTFQPKRQFWLQGPARDHAAIITHSWDNFQYFSLLHLITNKWGRLV